MEIKPIIIDEAKNKKAIEEAIAVIENIQMKGGAK